MSSQTNTTSLVLSRYDVLLMLIPSAFAAALAVHALTNVPIHAAVIGGAVVGICAVADGLFVNPPTNESETATLSVEQETGPAASAVDDFVASD